MHQGIRLRRSALPWTAALAALALAATACGGSDSEGGGAKNPADVSGSITWWDTAGKAEAPVYEKLVAAFEKKYPKIDVKRVEVPFDQAQQKFKTAARAKKGAPDVLRSEVGWTPGFAALGYLAPLDDTPAVAGKDDYLEGPLQGARFEGRTYAVPQVTDTLGLLYNKAILKKAGISEPPKTWKEIEAAAKKLKAKTPGVTATYVNPDSYYSWPFLYGEGGDMVDAAAKKITVNSPASVKGIEAATSLIDSGAAKRPDTTEGYNNMQAQMGSGKLAMIVDGPWATAGLLKSPAFKGKPENLGIAPIPGGSKTAGAPTGGHNLAVYAASEKLDASYLFVKFMNSADSQAKAAVANSTLPTRESAYRGEVTADPVRAAFRKALESAKPRPQITVSGELFASFNQNYAKILTGSSSVQDGLDATAKEWKSSYLKDFSTR
ncbi:extracellular solute-binding protein [Streptomyces sp. A7024]|uniref:Extracellular solute-binding protein n=1 Tax=Streptomyces coryli TaxID=1128680 RepID=A0A6G4TT21_9ACTN|nr:extracellular solute-binding protein [Streptomyces coryli]NGN62953.1 extracellular solute-binding protein [Streptomyces coryli]